MDIYEAIQKRGSIRSYRDDPVSEEKLKKILNAGRMAPSAHNSQDYKFIVVKDVQRRKMLSRTASGQKFIAEAPVIIAAVSLNPEHLMGSGIPVYLVDIAIAIDHMTLAAVEEGLGTCWIGAFSQEEVKKNLNIPKEYKVVILLPLGVPYEEPGVKSRKSLKELVCYEKFSK